MVTYATGTPGSLATQPPPIIGLTVTPQSANYANDTLAQMTDRCLWRLGEAFQTTIGDYLVSHDYSPPEIPRKTTRQLVRDLLNEGAARLCRGPLFVYKTGAQEVTVTNREVTYQSLATDDGSVLWSAESVTWTPDAQDPVALRYIGRERALPRYGALGTSGLPTAYWSHSGNGIRPWELPGVTGYFTVRGPAIPYPMVADADVPAWCPPDMTYLLENYARMGLAEKVGAASVVRGKTYFPTIEIWRGEWQEAMAKIEAQTRAENPELYQFHMGQRAAM